MKHLTHPVKTVRSERGGTFAELMLATIIVGTTVVASTASLSESAEVYHYFADGPHEGLMLAQEIHEAALLLPWEAEAGAAANYGPDVVTIFDLDGEDYKPPRSADYEIVSSHLGWTQDIAIKVVDLNDPTTEVNSGFSGDTLTKLEVTVKNGNQIIGVFPWWMTEPDDG